MVQILPVKKTFSLYVAMAAVYVLSSPYTPYFLSPLLKASPILLLLIMSLLTLRGRQRLLTGMALGFSALGDVLLAMQFTHNFIAGLAAFLTAHVFYILVFSPYTNVFNKGWKLVWCVLVMVYCVLLGTLILPPEDMLKAAVMLYILVLSIMCFVAISSTTKNLKIQAVGALVFAISDSIIAWDAFRQPIAYASIWIMVTYYMAQAMIFLGAFSLGKSCHHRESDNS